MNGLLHKTSRMTGYHILATDGEIGHVKDFLVDEATWAIRYLVVDTSNWVGGRSVLISAGVVDSIDSGSRKIRVRLTRSDVERGPSVDLANIDLEETLPSIWIF
jgi:hypothetical protein